MSNPPSRPSLKNIAEEAGVSVSLVSKVLNNRLGNTGVTEALAEKIRRTAKEMAYRKNLSAESLRTGRHNAVGVMLHRHGAVGSGLNENVIRGIAEFARGKRQKLILSFFERNEEFMEMCDSAHRGMMDGLIIGGALHPELKDQILEIQNQGLPVVTIFNNPMHPKLLNVGMDQARITELTTCHLLEQGCKTVGTIQADQARHAGYLRAMRDWGIAINPDWVYQAEQHSFTYQTGESAVKFWLQSGSLPDGIVGESDAHAMGAINALQEAGLKVPEDVKVTGIDNSPFCEYIRPAITSVSQEHFVRGEMAMKMILKISKGNTADHQEVAPVLIVRDSSLG